MLEGSSAKLATAKEMPIMIIFKRLQFRMFPDKQIVALYYSKVLNKYLSIPFGPKGNVNLSEATVIEPEMLEEDWQSVNRKDKTDGLSQAAVNAYRRENPGSKLKTAVTEKKPKGKRAARRKSFCSRMGGMKKRLTNAKNARDPDSPINKALRRWNCEESFKQKLNEKRQERLDEFLPLVIGAGEALTGLAARAAIGGVARSLGRSAIRAGVKVAGKTGGKVVRGAGRLAGSALKNALRPDDEKKQAQQGQEVQTAQKEKPHAKIKSYAASELAKNRSSDTLKSIESQAQRKAAKGVLSSPSKMSDVHENKISHIRNLINEGVDSINLSINGKTVTLNSNMAKRIVEVYDSVNTKNKKIVEGMLNEDFTSFKKLLNFSIKV